MSTERSQLITFKEAPSSTPYGPALHEEFPIGALIKGRGKVISAAEHAQEIWEATHNHNRMAIPVHEEFPIGAIIKGGGKIISAAEHAHDIWEATHNHNRMAVVPSAVSTEDLNTLMKIAMWLAQRGFSVLSTQKATQEIILDLDRS